MENLKSSTISLVRFYQKQRTLRFMLRGKVEQQIVHYWNARIRPNFVAKPQDDVRRRRIGETKGVSEGLVREGSSYVLDRVNLGRGNKDTRTRTPTNRVCLRIIRP